MNGNWIKTEDGDSYSDFWGLIYLNEDDIAHWQKVVICLCRALGCQASIVRIGLWQEAKT